MVMIWGFDLAELSWSAFSRKSMFDPHWYLRPQRLVVYSLANIVVAAAQGTATYSFFKYRFLRNHIEDFSMHTAHVLDEDIIAAAILTMAFSPLVQLLLTIEYFILLFWPNRMYPRRYNSCKKWIITGFTAVMTVTAIVSTVIFGTHSATISGVDKATALQYTQLYSRPPLKYNTWPQNIAWIVLLWVAVVLSIASVILLRKAISHDEKHGIKPKEARESSAFGEEPMTECI